MTCSAGSGPYWSIASYLVWGGTCADGRFTGSVQVYPGDSIYGYIQAIQCNSGGCGWTITTTDTKTGGTETINVEVGYMPDAYVALEVYNVVQCTDLPGGGNTYFYNLNVKGGTPGWQNELRQNTGCGGQNIVAQGSSQVWLYYSNAPPPPPPPRCPPICSPG